MPEADVKHVDAPPPEATRNEDIKRDEATGLPLEPLRQESINEPPGSNVLGIDASEIEHPSNRPPLPQPKPPIAKPEEQPAESAAQQQLKNP